MQLTRRIAKEITTHEGVVLEAYKDSKDVWTWGIGITNASGHEVYPRYLDKPQTLQKVAEIYIWLLRLRYIPDVEHAFDGHDLTEAQFGAALSFHFNTGKIRSATWVDNWKSGDITAARRNFLAYRFPPGIRDRRKAEHDLFFDGIWSGTGRPTQWTVSKPSYKIDWSQGRRVDLNPFFDMLIPE